jgi:hypothetical protein
LPKNRKEKDGGGGGERRRKEEEGGGREKTYVDRLIPFSAIKSVVAQK